MSLLDTASLIVTPNGYKEGKLYSVIPSDGSGDLSVTRATTATRVNSAGLVELVPYNLVQYSQDLSNTWYNANGILSSNATTAPDGTNTADKIIADTTNGIHVYQQTVSITSGVVHTLSVFVKAAEYSVFELADASSLIGQTFNLTTQTISVAQTGSFNPATSAAITNEGNGWYRCSITYTSNSTTAFTRLSLSNGTTTSFAGNGVNGTFIWGAQLNEGTIKPYQKTETRLNIPRLDYSNGTCPSILVEPQRTNLIRYSEDFTNGVWGLYSSGTGVNPIVTANTTTAPNGTNTADTIVLNAGAGTTAADQSQIYQTFSITIGNVYTFSFYAKGSVGGEQLMIRHAAGSSYTKITLTNDWARYEVTETATYTGTGFLELVIRRGLNEPINASCTFYAWGAQVELGSYATSYIPTTSASVTRNADVISKTGISSLIGQTEGTLFLDIDFNNITQVAGVDTLMTLNNGTTDNEISILLDTPAGAPKTFLGYIRNAASNQAIIYAASPITTTRYKVAFSYKLNDIVLYINGTQIGTDTSATIPSTTALSLSSRSDNSFLNIQQEYVQAAALWKNRLTNTQLAQLTTI